MKPGEIFDGKYKIIKTLGAGGTSTVYLAENIRLGSFWAIKEILKKPGSRVDFKIEPNILKKLNHPALPRIFDIYEDEEKVCLLVDYIGGIPLNEALKRDGKYREEVVVPWFIQICEVLRYLHTQKPNPIIYRDMKPSNLILQEDGTLKLIDFGIAREFKEGFASDTVCLGTRGYAAPEQYGTGQTGVSSDIFSLGITVYHLLTGIGPGQPLFNPSSLRDADKKFSAEMENIIGKCTALKPEERYQSVGELLADLNGICPGGAERNLQKTPLKTGFKKLVITVLGSKDFACELGYIASKLAGCKVLLINLDFLNCGIETYFNLGREMEASTQEGIPIGIKALDYYLKKKELSEKCFTQCSFRIKGLSSLYLVCDPFNVANCRKFKSIDIAGIMEHAYRYFDITIAAANDSILDPMLFALLERSDYNIAAFNANFDDLRKYEGILNFAFNEYNVPLEKSRAVAFEYSKELNLPVNTLQKFFPGEGFLGYVNRSMERERSRNLNSVYSNAALKNDVKEYEKILAKLGIMPSEGFKDRLRNWWAGLR